MLHHGLLPIEKRTTNYSFPRTFGAVHPLDLPEAYNADAGLTVPDQNADGLYNGCSGYTQSELCQDEDQVLYKPYFTYDKTLLIGGGKMGDPCSIYDSLKSTVVYGVQRDTENTDTEAYLHKRGQYYQVERTNGLDWFDAVRSALWVNRGARRSVSIGSPWFREFQDPLHGIVKTVDVSSGWDAHAGHNYKISGWKMIDGEPYLIIKPWCGKSYGDKGFAYFSREVVNKLMAVDGVSAFTLAQWDGKIQTVQLGILYTLQVLISLYRRRLFGV